MSNEREFEGKDLEDVLQAASTSLGIAEPDLDYDEMRNRIESKEEEFLLLFGTGWGLTDEVVQKADYRLRPIKGPTGYHHLSVRSAVSIILDRILGER